jgi:pyruvate/2-oxoglutarate dehydrogenase complex dihydrolipoamide dehydrogenase (E3) component
LVATGRVANLDDIGLETVGLQHAASGGQLAVDEHLRVQGSVNSCDAPWLWAIGDITGHGGFTHLSMYQAGLALKDILGQDPEPAQYHAIPSVTFTDPEVAAVGLTAAQAVASGLAVTTG